MSSSSNARIDFSPSPVHGAHAEACRTDAAILAGGGMDCPGPFAPPEVNPMLTYRTADQPAEHERDAGRGQPERHLPAAGPRQRCPGCERDAEADHEQPEYAEREADGYRR